MEKVPTVNSLSLKALEIVSATKQKLYIRNQKELKLLFTKIIYSFYIKSWENSLGFKKKKIKNYKTMLHFAVTFQFIEFVNSLQGNQSWWKMQKILLKILQNSEENIYVGVSFLIKVSICRLEAFIFTKILSSTGVFLWNWRTFFNSIQKTNFRTSF